MLRALFEELRRLKQHDLVEAEGMRDPIKRAYALVAAQEQIEWVERRIERRMKEMRVPNAPRVSMEIKQGLMACADYKNCTDCPYNCEEEGCMRALTADALTLIRQLEAKLAEYEKPLVPMTLEEVKRHVKEPEAELVWLDDVEEPSNTGWTYSHIICDWLHGFDERTYGKEWRCWSRKPTDEERKAAKWDETT